MIVGGGHDQGGTAELKNSCLGKTERKSVEGWGKGEKVVTGFHRSSSSKTSPSEGQAFSSAEYSCEALEQCLHRQTQK